MPPNSYSVRCADINQLRNQNPTCVATTLREVRPIYHDGSIAGEQTPKQQPFPVSSTTASSLMVDTLLCRGGGVTVRELPLGSHPGVPTATKQPEVYIPR